MSKTSEQRRAERKFIHDIASSIGSALFMSDVLIEKLRESKASLAEIEVIITSLNKAKTLLDTRRTHVIKEQRADVVDDDDNDNDSQQDPA